MGCSLAWSLPRYFPFFLPFWIFLGPLFFVPRHERRGEIELHERRRFERLMDFRRARKKKKGKLLFFNDRSNSIFGLYYWRTFRSSSETKQGKLSYDSTAILSRISLSNMETSRGFETVAKLSRSSVKINLSPCYLRSYLHFDSKLSFRDLICVQCDKDFVSLLVEINDYQFLIWLIFKNCCGRRK